MQLITTIEATERYRLSRSSIWRYRRRYPDFPRPIELNGFHLRWPVEELDVWFSSHRESAHVL